ncbi:MAG: C40 family peptidase [Eggerthellaceae bacterium]|nr:C40 family peptidase [Eggerthellaceae bacterium]
MLMERSFKMTSCGIIAAFVAALMAMAMFASPAYAVTAAEKEAEAEEALKQLHSMQETLQQTSSEYYQSLAEYQDAVTLRDAAQARIDEITKEIASIQSRLGERARDMYRHGSASFVDLLFGAATFDEFTQNLAVLNRVNESDAKMVSDQRKYREEAEKQKEEYAKQTAIADDKAKKAGEAYQKSQKLVVQMEETYNSLSAEAARLYEEERIAAEQAAAEAAAAAAAEAAAAEAAAAEAAEMEGGAAEMEGGDDAEMTGGIQNDDGTVTDSETGQVYSSAAEYSSSTGNAIVDRAASMLGSSYRYGGTGEDGTFDCSGLVGYAITGTTERIGNTTSFMEDYNQVSDPQPGDIAVNEGHTGIYIGNGQMIHASDESTGVITGPVQSGMIFVRP